MIRGARVGVVLALLSLLVPALSHAQASMVGVVKDTSGGVLPGVLVEATSPVLIEGTKSMSTDEAGQFRIIDLRPGVYVVTFSLTGFQTVKIDRVELEGESTRTVNAELKLGTVAEALTVSGAAPVVDVSNAVRITSLEKTMLDNMPVGNNIWEMAQLIPAIDMYADGIRRASSVAGSAGAVQTYMSVNGGEARNNVVMVDGMTVSGLEADGTVQAYFNQSMNSEVSYQTSGISADRSGGGVSVNMIPREGGNRFSGDGKWSFKPDDWIANNTTDRIREMGLTTESSVRYLSDEAVSQGGPILRNKLWFFGSFHEFDTSDYQPAVLKDNGEQFSGDQRVRQGSIRLTYQAAPRVKLTGYYDKTQKYIDGSSISANDDPETSSWQFTTPRYATGNLKVTAPLTSRLLVEGGYSFNDEWRDEVNPTGQEAPRGTPQWYEVVAKFGPSALNTSGYASSVKNYPSRYNYQGSISYVTGAHQIKSGMSWQTGSHFHSNHTNGDLWSHYQAQTRASCPNGPGLSACTNAQLVPDPNGAEWKMTLPNSISAWNTPVNSRERLNKDIGIYVQDSWRLKRLTINTGLRWEHLNAQNDPASTTEGRWSFTRSIDGVTNVPDWYDWAPRFSTVWDVFGDARTAVKYSLNRYNYGASTGLAASFNVLTVGSRNLTWNDKNGNDFPDGSPGFIYNADGTVDYGPGFCTTAMFQDPANIGCELNMQSLYSGGVIGAAKFGTTAAEQEYQGYPRRWILEQIFEVQHALTNRLSLTFSFTRGDYQDQTSTVNLARQPGDYIPMTIYHPIDGTPITVWSIKDVATQQRITNNAQNLTFVEPLNKYIPKTLALEFRMRPYAGAQIFGGFTAQRFESINNCATSLPGGVINPNSLRYCDQTKLSGVDDHGFYDDRRTTVNINGQTINTLGFTALPSAPVIDPGGPMPFSKDFRIGVSLPLPWFGINFGASYLNNDEGGLSTLAYSIRYATSGFVPGTCLGGNVRYPDGRTDCTGTAAVTDAVIQGVGRNQKIATAFTAPACPTEYGCVPGTAVLPSDFLTGTIGGTTHSVSLYPGSATTRNKRERLNQLDLKVSKTFRIRNVSVLPTVEVGNLFNQDKITGYLDANYANTGGTYLVPSILHQSRIIGAGVQVRW